MAIKNVGEYEPIRDFEQWYREYRVDPRTGVLRPHSFTDSAERLMRDFRVYEAEMQARVKDYHKYEKQAASEVVSKKADLPNVASGESAGFIRRMARNTVQHTPNVEILNQFDQESVYGHMAEYILKSKVIGDDQYSNDMQQNLITTARRGFALGFDCVIPVLRQNALNQWYIHYDPIYYKDVFPEPGATDVRQASDVFVRRYLTRKELHTIVNTQPTGWDIAAAKALMLEKPRAKKHENHENQKHGHRPEGYSVITWYSSSGDPFLTFSEDHKFLLRVEKNKHPLKEHPVFFFVPEKDDQQPLGKSLLSLTFGRQEFQDLFLNGAMKLWYRNINPPIIGYGAPNAIPNLSPGKYTQINNPNAKVEAFEVNPQSLMMFQSIATGNAGNMIQQLGAADQQMASQATGGMMSQTPQGVEAQQGMVDITTNDYQKALEAFFSRYCSYALTIYFQELKGTSNVTPTALARKQLIDGGLDEGVFQKDGSLTVNFEDMATLYYCQTVPGSLIEMEEEKQVRILNEMFVPLSQAMPAIAAAGDEAMMRNASAAMQFIIKKQIELSGSHHSSQLKAILEGRPEDATEMEQRLERLESALAGADSSMNTEADLTAGILTMIQEQVSLLARNQEAMARAWGVGTGESTPPDALEAGEGETPAPTPQLLE